MPKKKLMIIFVVCYALYLLIKGTLNVNNVPPYFHIIEWIPILICIICDFLIFLKYFQR